MARSIRCGWRWEQKNGKRETWWTTTWAAPAERSAGGMILHYTPKAKYLYSCLFSAESLAPPSKLGGGGGTRSSPALVQNHSLRRASSAGAGARARRRL